MHFRNLIKLLLFQKFYFYCFCEWWNDIKKTLHSTVIVTFLVRDFNTYLNLISLLRHYDFSSFSIFWVIIEISKKISPFHALFCLIRRSCYLISMEPISDRDSFFITPYGMRTCQCIINLHNVCGCVHSSTNIQIKISVKICHKESNNNSRVECFFNVISSFTITIKINFLKW